jgi:dTDP-4-amino-4,6-dideoxygalactose transaminase
MHPVYQRRFGWQPADYPNADEVGRTTISLPLSAKLAEEDVADVTNAIREVLG